MQKIKNERGLTIIALVATISILLLIFGVTIYSSRESFKIKDLTNLYSDIEILEDRVKVYYAKYNKFPIVEDEIETIDGIEVYKINFNDEDEDIKKINGLHNDKEKFYIDITTGKVYLYGGVEYQDSIYYTIQE